MTIKIKLINGALPLEIIKKGDWIDLRANEDVFIAGPEVVEGKIKFHRKLIPLGVAMQLPAGYEAIVAARSSTYKTYGVIPWNGIGVIDNSYSGNKDEWKFGAIAFTDTEISKGDRICQFRIQLNQKATVWQRLKWLLTGGKITFETVDSLSAVNRAGFGEGTGAK